METKGQRKGLIIFAVIAAIVGIVAAKYLLQQAPRASAPSISAGSNGPAVYLFLNEKDQDSGCQAIYGIYENEKAKLPPGVSTARLDVNRDDALFKKFDVRILPSIFFINGKGEVAEKIQGEGEETEVKIKKAFDRAGELLGL